MTTENTLYKCTVTFRGNVPVSALRDLQDILMTSNGGFLIFDSDEISSMSSEGMLRVPGGPGVSVKITMAEYGIKKDSSFEIVCSSKDKCTTLGYVVASALNNFGEIGNCGHSYDTTFIPKHPRAKRTTIDWDGDGCDSIRQDSIKINGNKFNPKSDKRIEAMATEDKTEKNALDAGIALHLVGHGSHPADPENPVGKHITAIPENKIDMEVAQRLLDLAKRVKEDGDKVARFIIALKNQLGSHAQVLTPASEVIRSLHAMSQYQRPALTQFISMFRSEQTQATHIPAEFPIAYRLITNERARKALHDLMDYLSEILRKGDAQSFIQKLADMLEPEFMKTELFQLAKAVEAGMTEAGERPMNHISSIVGNLDKIAGRLEKLGLITLATELDAVSNSLETSK